MVQVTFEYADAMSKWKWRRQTCVVSSVRECIKLYGLGMVDPLRLAVARFQVGGRWFDDIVENNARREHEK